MRLSGKALMTLCLLLTTIWVVISALGWPLRSALFPAVTGSAVFFMALAELLFTLRGKEEAGEGTSGVDVKLSDDIDPKVANRRTLLILIWIFFFYLLILLVGFPVAVPLFFFFFLRFGGKEGWVLSIGFAVLAWGSFYGLFIRLLDTPFPEGWIQRLLRIW